MNTIGLPRVEVRKLARIIIKSEFRHLPLPSDLNPFVRFVGDVLDATGVNHPGVKKRDALVSFFVHLHNENMLSLTDEQKKSAIEVYKSWYTPKRKSEYRKRRDKKKAEWKKYKSFFRTKEWIQLRYDVLALHGARCQCCGRTYRDGVVLHVDHIKPRSKYPELELDINNLQVLCEDCNLGKSNRFEVDHR